MTKTDPYWKYEHLIREPLEVNVRAHTDPWSGAEVVIEQTERNTARNLVFTVEEAFTLRDALDAYLTETYPVERESVTIRRLTADDCTTCGHLFGAEHARTQVCACCLAH